MYLQTECDNFLGVEELTEDEFLNYFKQASDANS
jgi:hypothetical protein